MAVLFICIGIGNTLLVESKNWKELEKNVEKQIQNLIISASMALEKLLNRHMP